MQHDSGVQNLTPPSKSRCVEMEAEAEGNG